MLKNKTLRCRGCLGLVEAADQDPFSIHFPVYGRYRHVQTVEKTVTFRGYSVANWNTDGIPGLDASFRSRPCNYVLYDADVYSTEGV